MIDRFPVHSSSSPTPRALRHAAQGCARHERYPGSQYHAPVVQGRTATRFRPRLARMDGTPLGFTLETGRGDSGAPGLFQPWAARPNPFGIPRPTTKGATA